MRRVGEQLDRFLHAYDYVTEIRTVLYERLAETVPDGLTRFQMYSGGTETVEAGLRLARAATGRDEFVSLYRAFHGKTMGSASLAGAGLRRQFGAKVGGFYLTPGAYCYRCPLNLRYPSCGVACADLIGSVVDHESGGRVAAVVVEPVQGAGGVIVPPPEFLPKLADFCRDRGILLLIDEILTAPGRTGRLWASEHSGVQPDVMTMSKGIGSGFPVGVLAARESVAAALPGKQYGANTTTFGGSPAAAAAVLATLDVVIDEGLVERAEKLGSYLLGRLQDLQERYPCIGEVRGQGLLIGIEFVRDRATREPISLAEADVLFLGIVRRGLLVASAGPVLRLTPPLVLTQELADRGLAILDAAIGEFEEQLFADRQVFADRLTRDGKE
jgi:4-aminobutyrate aminotransferase-like enzyme